jgi:hypothetical protein
MFSGAQVGFEKLRSVTLMNLPLALRRLLATVQSPPPWLWCASGRIWQRFGARHLWRLPLELIQQLHWWLIRPSYIRRRPPALRRSWPWTLAFRACWLNSYRPSEVAWWWALGERSWARLSLHHPESLVSALHVERRQGWPDQCRPALRLLSDKAALLASCPSHWRAPFLVLPPQQEGASVQQQETPDWWWRALQGSGVVMKPQWGHAGRAVIRFRWADSGLQQEALFRRLPETAAVLISDAIPEPQQLLEHWRRLCHTNEAALAAPYLTHSSVLPATDPSVVVRVITERATADAPVGLREAWLEVPLGEGTVAFISTTGLVLPSPGDPLSASNQASLAGWQKRLQGGPLSCVEACLEAAQALHALLPPIDQVAWDWIPAEPGPLLLEGNGGFGLLVPQLFEQLHRGAGDA